MGFRRAAAHAERSRRKYFDHPEAGRIGLDCDTFIVWARICIMIYSAEPGSADAQRLELAVLLGTQALAAPGRGSSLPRQ